MARRACLGIRSGYLEGSDGGSVQASDFARRRGKGFDLGGFALIIASAFSYSFLGILGKLAYEERLPFVSLLATRFTIAAAILIAIVMLRPRLRSAWAALPRRRAQGLVLWGMFGFAGQSALYFAALRLISASLNEVLLYTCPAFLALIVWGISRRRPPAMRLVAIGLALLGTWICAGPIDRGSNLLGVGLAVLAGLWYASFLLVLDRLTPGIPGLLSGALIVTGAAIAFDALALFTGEHTLPRTPTAWGVVLGMVFSATILGFVLFVAGMKRVGPQVASILSTFEPLGTLLLAAAILGERLLPAQWVGAALILTAALVLAMHNGTRQLTVDSATGNIGRSAE
jgi:drug/metabolite transporter (DMT)-like permease